MRNDKNQPAYTEDLEVMFQEKSKEFPGGRIALLSRDRIAFPELRFNPEVGGKKYKVTVDFYDRRDSIIGIAYPKGDLSETEYNRDEQIVIAVTFMESQNGYLVARHPVTGAYITPTSVSEPAIRKGVQCWVMLVQRGISIYGHFLKNVEDEETPPEATSTNIANYDASFAAKAEQSIASKKGMGKAPVFRFLKELKRPWEIMGISKEATMEDIKAAYKKMAKKYHPDINRQANHEDFVALALAHDWLTFRRQWADDVAAKLAAQSKKAETKPVEEPKKLEAPADPLAQQRLILVGRGIRPEDVEMILKSEMTPEAFVEAAAKRNGSAAQLIGTLGTTAARLRNAGKRVGAVIDPKTAA